MKSLVFSSVFFVQLIVSYAFAQASSDADQLFEYFEFEKAAELYEKQGTNQLTIQQLENLAISYYHTFNGKKGISIADVLIEKNPKVANYYLLKARFLKENGEFEGAKNAISNYQKLGGKEPIQSFVESCDLWLNAPSILKGSIENNSLNDTRANFQSIIGKEVVFFKERGLNRDFEEVRSNDEINAEVFLLTPYIMKNGQLTEWKLINDPGKYYSISSIQVSHSLQKLYFSAALPLSNDRLKNQFQLFEADFNGFDVAATNIQLWKNWSLDDSSSNSQLALSDDEKTLVFSKMGSRTKGADLYFSQWQNGQWSIPIPLSNLNTDGDDVFPNFIGDSLFAYSTNGRVGFGELDIFYGKLEGQLSEMQNFEHAPLPINSTADDFYFYKTSQDTSFFSSNRFTGKGDDDLWSFVSEPVIIASPEPEPELESIDEHVKGPNIDSLLNEWNKERANAGFNKDHSAQKFSYIEELKGLIDQGYRFHIVVIGSADNRGSDTYNDALGLRRAENRRTELVNQGIPAEVMEVKSIGAREPIGICPAKGTCPESVHEQNRFVRLQITEVK